MACWITFSKTVSIRIDASIELDHCFDANHHAPNMLILYQVGGINSMEEYFHNVDEKFAHS